MQQVPCFGEAALGAKCGASQELLAQMARSAVGEEAKKAFGAAKAAKAGRSSEMTAAERSFRSAWDSQQRDFKKNYELRKMKRKEKKLFWV